MSMGYRDVTANELSLIVRRLTSPTRASLAKHHLFDAQEAQLAFCRSRDPLFHPRRTANVPKVSLSLPLAVEITFERNAQFWIFVTTIKMAAFCSNRCAISQHDCSAPQWRLCATLGILTRKTEAFYFWSAVTLSFNSPTRPANPSPGSAPAARKGRRGGSRR